MGKPKETWNPYRQVIQLGVGSGLVVSLPNAWCRKNGIKKGQIIRLEEVIDLTSKEGTGLVLKVLWPENDQISAKSIELSSTKPTMNPGGIQ